MSAARERGGRRAPLPQVLAFAIVLSTALPWTGLPSTATAGTASLSVTNEVAALDVLAAPGAGGTVREGQPLTVRVTLSNNGSTATGPLRVELRLDGARVASAGELSSWFADLSPSTSPRLDERLVAAEASLGALDAGSSAVLDLTVPALSPSWDGGFGARLAEVVIASGDQWLAGDRTAVVRVPVGATLGVAATTFVQPLSAPGEPAGLLSASTLETLTLESGALTRALNSSAGRPVLLAIDPRIIASITALGESAPTSAVDFLNRLRAAPNESFLLPWADADPLATQAAAGVSLPLVEGSGVLDGEITADPGLATPAPSDSPDGVGTVTQRVSELIDFTPTLTAVAWPQKEGFSTASITALAAEGTRVIMTPSAVLDGDAAVQGHGDVTLLRTDDELSGATADAVRAASQQQFDRALARVAALLATSAASDPGGPTLIALDRGRPRGSDRMLDTLAQIIALPWVTAGTVSDALALPRTDAEIIDTPLDDTRGAAVVAALDAEAADRQFAQIALAPALITDGRRLELLAALSLGWGENSVEALRGFVTESQALRASVQVVESSAILLLTDRATLPVTVQNNLDVPVQVFVRVDPDTAQLRVLNTAVETIVEPRSQARTLVPVESLTNGEVDITVTVRDAQSRVLSEPTRVSLSLQAGWETAGVIVVAIAVALLFVVGIARDLRKRSRRAVDAGSDGAETVKAAEPSAKNGVA